MENSNFRWKLCPGRGPLRLEYDGGKPVTDQQQEKLKQGVIDVTHITLRQRKPVAAQNSPITITWLPGAPGYGISAVPEGSARIP